MHLISYQAQAFCTLRMVFHTNWPSTSRNQFHAHLIFHSSHCQRRWSVDHHSCERYFINERILQFYYESVPIRDRPSTLTSYSMCDLQHILIRGTRYCNTGCACFPWFLSIRNSTLLLFITAVSITNLCVWREEDSGGHVLYDTTSRGLCGLV